jgi:hypothetical protein
MISARRKKIEEHELSFLRSRVGPVIEKLNIVSGAELLPGLDAAATMVSGMIEGADKYGRKEMSKAYYGVLAGIILMEEACNAKL